MRLDPKRGVNPALLTCTGVVEKDGKQVVCGEGHSVGLLGTGGYKATCLKCGAVNIGDASQHICNYKECKGYLGRSERLREGESVPVGLCAKCAEKWKKAQEEIEQVVRDGGVYWKCSSCDSSGAIKAGAGIAMAVRQNSSVEAPGLVGLDFDGQGCPVCDPQPELEETEQ